MGRRLGLLVGINHYQDTSFLPLQYAESDASMFAQWLTNARGGNWSSSDIQLVIGSQATKETVESFAAQLCLNVAEAGDLLLFYFAGHAFIDESSGEGYLACAGSSYRSAASGIHLQGLISNILALSRVTEVVFILDCFQTGLVWDRLRSTPFDFAPFVGNALAQGLQQAPGRILYCSCRGNRLAAETGERSVGSFLYRTIIGLSGPALDAATGQTTLQRLHAYLAASLPSQHQPQVFGQAPYPLSLAGELYTPEYATPDAQFTPSTLSPTRRPKLTTPLSPSASNAGQVTFQGVGESGTLAQASLAVAAATDQFATASANSGPISISQVEQNYQQQCQKLTEQARQLVALQNFPEALSIVDQVLHMAPTFPEALTLKAQVLGATGRPQEALPVVEQLLSIEPSNALAWSLRAALLTNTHNLPEALQSIERALALQPGNIEAQTMRATIQAGMAAGSAEWSARAWQSPYGAYSRQARVQGSAASFFIYAGLQIFALIIGIAGAALPVFQPSLPIIASFSLESLGLALLCVLAARGAYLYGIGRVIWTLLLCLMTAGILGGIYKFGYARLVAKMQAFPPLIVPVLFLAFWLVAAAALPLLLSIGGFIIGLARGVRRNR